jgi:hypothetical protein
MTTGETVAVKVLATDSKQGEKEFQTEVLLVNNFTFILVLVVYYNYKLQVACVLYIDAYVYINPHLRYENWHKHVLNRTGSGF